MPPLDARTSSKIACFGLICAFFVVMLHVPQPIPSSSATSSWWLFHLAAGTFGRLGVPFYFVVSGFFLARHFGEPSWWKRETSKRVKSLVVPFMFWLALWNAAEAFLAALSNLRSGAMVAAGFPTGMALLARFGLDPFDYPSDIPLWFVRSLFLYVMASGVLFPILKRLGVTVPIVLLALSAVMRLDGVDVGACRFLSRFVSLHGLFYFVLGASLPLGVLRMPARNLLSAALGAAGFVGMFAAQFLASRDVVWWGVVQEISLPFALLTAWWMFPHVKWSRSQTALTFPIYILHVFVIRALDVSMYGELSCSGLVLKYVATSALTLGAAAMSRAFLPRFHSFAFGGR